MANRNHVYVGANPNVKV